MELKANEFPLTVSGEQKTNKFKKNIITILFFFFLLKKYPWRKKEVCYICILLYMWILKIRTWVEMR